jgi:hypothetical protein
MEIVSSTEWGVTQFGRGVGEIRLVCKGWGDECDQHITTISLDDVRGPTTVSEMRTFLQRFPSLESAVFTREEGILTDGNLTLPTWAGALDSLSTSLIRLCFIGDGAYDGEYLRGLSGCTALTTLRLRCSFPSVLGLEGLSSLESLWLSGTREVLDDDAFSSLAGLTNLTDLDLTNCHKLSPTHGFATLICFTALTSLYLEGTRANDSVLLGTVSKLPALTYLTIKNFELDPGFSKTAARSLKNTLPKINIWWLVD